MELPEKVKEFREKYTIPHLKLSYDLKNNLLK